MNNEPMVPCDQVIARLWEFLDAELEAGREQEVQRHLDACARCFPEYDFRRAYQEIVRRTGTQLLPAGCRQRIFQAILAEEAAGRGDATPPADPAVLEEILQALRRQRGC
jgi:anti-sigma factor (TIGR02949 family)